MNVKQNSNEWQVPAEDRDDLHLYSDLDDDRLDGISDEAFFKFEEVERLPASDRDIIANALLKNERDASRARCGLVPAPAGHSLRALVGLTPNVPEESEQLPDRLPRDTDGTLYCRNGEPVEYVWSVANLESPHFFLISEFFKKFDRVLCHRLEPCGDDIEIVVRRRTSKDPRQWWDEVTVEREYESETCPNATGDGELMWKSAIITREIPRLRWRGDRICRESTGQVPRESRLLELVLPGGETKISSAAKEIGKRLGTTDRYFVRGDVPVLLSEHTNATEFVPIKSAALCSIIEGVARLTREKIVDGEATNVPAICEERTSRLILSSPEFSSALPKITAISNCPVLVERSSGALSQVVGYDRDSGIFAAGTTAPDVPYTDAVRMVTSLLDDFVFVSDGDRARALAALITPALVLGGLLRERVPADLGEADDSQTGKGYRNRITTAIYATEPAIVTQRKGGVGSPNETFDFHLVRGATFISFDNQTEKLSMPALESFLREDNYPARIPHSAPMMIDPRRVLVQITSNRAELTRDLANRTSCVRLLKQPDGYNFRSFPEGDLVAHVVANQPRYLGAVFSIIREWHRRGKPRCASAPHDFREWSCVLGWIVENLLSAGSMLGGHRQVQERMATKEFGWLRNLALAIRKSGRMSEWMRTNQLLRIAVKHQVVTPGIDLDVALDDEEFDKSNRKFGLRLGSIFGDETSLSIDSMTIERERRQDAKSREQTEYRLIDSDFVD